MGSTPKLGLEKRDDTLEGCPDCPDKYYDLLLENYRKALNEGDIESSEKFLEKLRKRDKGLQKCAGCEEDFYSLLLSEFDEALNTEDRARVEELLAKIEAVKKCPECREKYDKYVKIDLPIRLGEDFFIVNNDTYTIPPHLKRYMRFLNSESIVIDKPFYIQGHEVTIREFRKYVETLSDQELKKLGNRWEITWILKDGKKTKTNIPEKRPVENVTWQEANAYAQWLGNRKNWDLRLPTPRQWAAAAVEYAKETPIFAALEPSAKIRTKDIDHLIGNLREWSSESCGDGKYRLLGENYMTDMGDARNFGTGYCVKDTQRWAGVGFRLVQIQK